MTAWYQKNNELGAMLDALCYGAGTAIISGLGVTMSGLSATVAGGIALMGGIKSLSTIPAYTVPANTARVYLWLKSDGTLTHTTIVTPPANFAVYLGSLQTGTSAMVGSFDVSGVVYLRGGVLWRQTADTTTPGDTLPDFVRVFTQTANGLWLWNGAAHYELIAAGSVPKWRSAQIGYTGFQAAATSKALTAFTLAAGEAVHAILVDVGTAFAGTGLTDLNLAVGTTGEPDLLTGGVNMLATGLSAAETLQLLSKTSSVDIKATASGTGANLNVLSAGVLNLRLLVSKPF